MPRISLRDYLNKIDALITENSYEQSLYHSFYLLRQYPKYVEVYKRIGRAYLELNNLDSAANVFARLITVEPENFLNHLTMGLIMEMQSDVERAIYQTRLALFLQPENKDVIRLYQQLSSQRTDMREPASFRPILTALQAYRQNDFAKCHEILSTSDLDNYRYFGQLFIALSAYRLEDYANFIIISEELLGKNRYLECVLKLMAPLLKTRKPLREREYISRLHELNPEFSSLEDSQEASTPIELIYHDWTGFQNSKLRTIWHQPGSKIIDNQIDTLPGWLECLPICQDLIYPTSSSRETDSVSVSGFRSLSERHSKLRDEDIFFQKDYFRSQVADKPVEPLTTRDSRVDQPKNLIEIDSSAELEEAFGLLEQMIIGEEGLDESPDQIVVIEPEGKVVDARQEDLPKVVIDEETEERIRAAWNCFSIGQPAEGITRYRELIADERIEKRVKEDIRKLMILFPEHEELKGLL